jgi:hypothetical protein
MGDAAVCSQVKAESKTAAIDCMRHVVGEFQERAKKDNGTRFLCTQLSLFGLVSSASLSACVPVRSCSLVLI